MGTLSVGINHNYTNGSDSLTFRKQFSVTITGTKRVSGVFSIGTTEETIALGDVTTAGVVVVTNLDTTNYITVGSATTQRPIKIKAGETWIFRLDSSAIYIKADTAACEAYVEVYSST